MASSAFSGPLPARLARLACLTFLAAALPSPVRSDDAPSGAGLAEIGASRPFVRFAAVGSVDPGAKGGKRVCDRVRSWTPEFVLSLGSGGFPGDGAEVFGFPWKEGRRDLRRGPVHVFSLNLESDRPGGESGAEWLRKGLMASTAPWKIVCLSRAPYSSYGDASEEAGRGPRWPFRQWGADAVIAGRGGHYERLEADGMTYFVNGLEGEPPRAAEARAPGSQCLFDEDEGAMLVEADAERIDFRFVTAEGMVVDAHSLRRQSLAGRTDRRDGDSDRRGGSPAAVPAALNR